SADATVALVSALMKKDDAAAALKVIDGLALQNPKSALPDLLRGRVAEARNDPVAARESYEAALAKEAEFEPALGRLAQLDLIEQKSAAAKARYTVFLKRKPESVPALLAMAEITRLQGGSRTDIRQWLDKAVAVRPTDPAPWLTAIELEERLGEATGALARAQRASTALPDNAELLARLGQALLEVGNTNQAQAALQRAIVIEPRSFLARLRLAEAHLAAGNPGGARTQVDRAMELAPDTFAANRANIALLSREGKGEAAVAGAKRLRARLPGDLGAMLLEADVQAAGGQWAAAAAVLRDALAAGSTTDIAKRLSHALRRAGAKAGAESFEQAWLQQHSDDAEFLAFLAQEAAVRGDEQVAEARYRQAIELRPDGTLAINNLASLLLGKKPAEALTLAQRAVSLAPVSAPMLDTLAAAQARNGQAQEAVKTQTKAVDLAPGVDSLRLQLARLHLQSGDKDKAREELTRLVARGADSPQKPEAERLLKQLGS
ncbi:MAG: tetratricopeptide repeat protein, partial [Rubrivivax sp.]